MEQDWKHTGEPSPTTAEWLFSNEAYRPQSVKCTCNHLNVRQAQVAPVLCPTAPEDHGDCTGTNVTKMKQPIPQQPTGEHRADIAALEADQQMLIAALRLLFNLLEQYAPSWYAQEHHDAAAAALSKSNGSDGGDRFRATRSGRL